MPLSKIIAGVSINLVVPPLGLVAYILLCRRMQSRTPSPPFLPYFILFVNFGGWLMVLLTSLFWRWSGMASIGTFYLILIAPFLTAGIALRLHRTRSISGFHRTAYIASIAYSGLMLLLVAILVTQNNSIVEIG